MGTKVNLVVDQGATFETVLTLTQANGDLIDLTGYTGSAQLRKHYTSSNATTINVTLGGNNGTVTLGMTANATANVVAGRYVYDVELVDSANVTTRLIEGLVTVTPQVTR